MYINKEKEFYFNLSNPDKSLFKAYRFIANLNDTVPFIHKNWKEDLSKNLDLIKALVRNANLGDVEENELNQFYDYKSNVDYSIILNTFRKCRSLKEFKDLKNTSSHYTSITKKGIMILTNGLNATISKEECESYLNEFYSAFKGAKVPSITTNSNKDEIKYSLNKMVEVITKDRKTNFNHNLVGFIHSYFINQGNLNVMKSMEKFLSVFYKNTSIYKYYLEFNAKRNNIDSIIKLTEFSLIGDHPFKYSLYDKYLYSKKAYKKGTVDAHLCLIKFFYSRNKWNTNKKARQLLVETLKIARNDDDKLKCYILFMTHQKKINYKFREAFDFTKLEEEMKQMKPSRVWLHAMLILTLNYEEGYGVKKDLNKAKELFVLISKHTKNEVKDDNNFIELCNNFYQDEFLDTCKRLNLN